MTRYSDDELERMLADLESDRVERKETFKGSAPNTVREAVCALANDYADHRRPGVVFIGAKDDGTPFGLPVTDELLRQLADIKTDGNILPPPTMTVEKRLLFGAEMAVITVEPSDSPPVRYKGRIHIRFGPRRGLATTQDERVLNEKRRHGDRPFDLRPVPGSAVADLDCRFFEEVYLPSAFAPDILEANGRTCEQRLAATKMILSEDNPLPTVLGHLVLGRNVRDVLPGAYVQFLRVAGTELSDPVQDELPIGGTVAEVIRGLDEKIVSHNRISVDFTSDSREKNRRPYPPAALQQLARNAILHRAYEATNSPVRFTWFDDRIEIINPGGPFGAVRRENFGRPGLTDYRNPNLAEAMRVLGYVQRFGAGLPTARSALEKNGNPPPEFSVETEFIGVTIRIAP